MIIVRISDKRHHKGFKIKFFHTDNVTAEIVQFVKDTPKAYRIEIPGSGKAGEIYTDREKFLKDYC